MIYKCKDCLNRECCTENKAQYQALSTLVEAVNKLDRTEPFHCWYSLSLKCDYFIQDKKLCEQESCCGA